MFILISLIAVGCAHKREKVDQARMSYAKSLYQKKRVMNKRNFYIFLQKELLKKQQELATLENLKQQLEGRLSMDEQRERELVNSSSEQSQFSLIKSSHHIKLRDLEYQLTSVQRSIFDIRALMSEL